MIEISMLLWFKLITGLRIRGKGKRESGAFLLVYPGSKKVRKIVFYDQFDETVSKTGIIQFKGGNKFYQYLAEHKLEVIADIHTHPSSNTMQSESDRTHPLVRLKGHIAIIAPNFAKQKLLKPKDCSIYKYLGEFKWGKFKKSELPIKIKMI